MHIPADRKKRTSTSGSRSKSKKSTNNIKSDQTIELKPKSYHIFHNQDISNKIRTENSLSLNKSKATRKTSKSLKRPEKENELERKATAKESKDQSYLVSAERKHSVNKITKTEATHLESEDIFKKLYAIKKQLNKMKAPAEFSISEIEDYFNHIKESFANIAIEPLEYIFQKLHTMYVSPIENFLNIIRPYESILRRKEEISHMIKEQIEENQKLYEQLDPEDIEIIKLKEKIEKNAKLIEEMKKKKKVESNQISMKKKKSPTNENYNSKIVDISQQESPIPEYRIDPSQFESKLVEEYEKSSVFKVDKKLAIPDKKPEEKIKSHSFTEALQNNEEKISEINKNEDKKAVIKVENYSENEEDLENEYLHDLSKSEEKEESNDVEESQPKMGVKSAGVSFSFKLDLPKIDRSNLGFHDEFYSKLDEFSESWRNQALREKRF